MKSTTDKVPNILAFSPPPGHSREKHFREMKSIMKKNEARPDSPFPCWTRGEHLGSGSFGRVYKCHVGYDSIKIVAVKIVKVEPQYPETQEEVKALNNEIQILKKLNHKRIVSYYGSEQSNGSLHLFMDFMAGGSLSDHIKSSKVLSECLSKKYTKQMLEGVYFLHSQDIIHRDIKGANVLLDGKGNVKLADFGLSKMIQKVGSKTNLESHCGSPYWMAPEIICGEKYGRRADIWSLGCTVVEMLMGKPPLSHLEPFAAIFNIGCGLFELTLPESVSQDAKEFIKATLTRKPEERPSSDELQCYKFVSKAEPTPSWSLRERIGEGTYGEVYKCLLHRYDEQGTRRTPLAILAVKRLKMEFQDREKVETLQTEISILQDFPHERIVSYYGSHQDDIYLHLFMEYMPEGSLSDHIKKSGFLSEQESSWYTKQILEGVTFLHSRNLTHSYIKGSNVFLDSKGNVKLADFGLSRTTKIQKLFGSGTNLRSSCDTRPFWIAPEIFLGQGYGHKADIWSLGCTVVEMLTGNPPRSQLKAGVAGYKIPSVLIDIVPNASLDAKEFIAAALTWKPDKRRSSRDLQGYAFVTKSMLPGHHFMKQMEMFHNLNNTVCNEGFVNSLFQ